MSSYGDRTAQANALGHAPLVSGEAVPIDLRFARIGSRAIAALLDLMLELLVLAFVSAVFANLLNLGTAASRAFAIVAFLLVFLGYPVIMETAWSGRTLGKAAMGLRATRDDGGPLRFRQALVRGLTAVFIEKPGITLGFVAVICSMVSERGKRLGDLIAGTVVLQVRLPNGGAYLPAMPPPLVGWAAALDLSRFNDTLALQCRQFLGRADELSDEARERLGGSLVAAVQAAIVTPPPPGTPGWAYLSAVLAERRRREEQRLHAATYPVPPAYPPPTYPQPAYPPPVYPPPPVSPDSQEVPGSFAPPG